MRSLGLVPRLGAIVFAALALATLALSGVSARVLASRMAERFVAQGSATSLSVALALGERNDPIDDRVHDVQALIDANSKLPGVAYVYVENGEGDILVHTFASFPEEFVEQNTIRPGELTGSTPVKVLAGDTIELPTGTLSSIDIAAPIGDGRLGVVHVGMDRALIVAEVVRLRRRMLALGGLFALLSTLLAGAVIASLVVRPIGALTRATERVVQTGDLSEEIGIRVGGETGRLVNSFNRMIGDLRRSRADLAQRNEELVRASKAKSDFLASMSHELRTPMNAIIGYTDLVLTRMPDLDPKMRRNLEKVLSNSQHLLALINGVLDLAKVEAGKMELSLADAPLGPLFESTVSMAEGLVKGRPLKLVASIEPGLPVARVDATKLRQMVLNLLSNACKFTHQGHVALTVKTEDERRRLRIVVEDTGIGMAKEDLPKLFEEFKQVGKGGAYGGTGLGLVLVKRMAQLMGGDVAVDSELGKGTTFTVTLPIEARAAAAEAAAPALRPVAAAAAKARAAVESDKEPVILVVDPEPEAIVLVRELLAPRPYRVVSASSADEALRMAYATRPFAILLEVQLPDRSGWELVDELRAQDSTKATPIVIVSIADDMRRGAAADVADYFVKPVDRAQLLERVDRLAQA